MRRILNNLLRKKTTFAREQLEEWLQTLEIDAPCIADVGSGSLPVKNRVKSWKVEHYDLLGPPEFDLNRSWEAKAIYDVVFCLEVFEYMYNPMQAMNNLYGILKVGGVLYSSFHFIYPHHSPMEIDYLRYTRWGVEKLLAEAGFQSWEINPRYLKNPWLIGEVYLDENMRGNNNNRGTLHREQGYLVKAIK